MGIGGLFPGAEGVITLGAEEAGDIAEVTGETDGGDGGDEAGEKADKGEVAVEGEVATGDGVLVVGGDAVGLTLGLAAFFGEVTGDVVVVGAPADINGEADGDCA